MRQTHTILVAEGDPVTREFLADNLTADGYTVLGADSRPKAISLLAAKRPDVVVVDVNGETLELLDAVRSADGLACHIDSDIPMIVLTNRPDAVHRIRMLERGGDDVIAKPFSYPELRARIAALLRRADARRRPRVRRVGPIAIDAAAREVHVGERRVDLSAKEYELLMALAADPTRVFTREELLRDVWGFRTPVRTRTLDSHAFRLRQKLAGAGSVPLIVTVWGIGYRLCDPALVR